MVKRIWKTILIHPRDFKKNNFKALEEEINRLNVEGYFRYPAHDIDYEQLIAFVKCITLEEQSQEEQYVEIEQKKVK